LRAGLNKKNKNTEGLSPSDFVGQWGAVGSGLGGGSEEKGAEASQNLKRVIWGEAAWPPVSAGEKDPGDEEDAGEEEGEKRPRLPLAPLPSPPQTQTQ